MQTLAAVHALVVVVVHFWANMVDRTVHPWGYWSTCPLAAVCHRRFVRRPLSMAALAQFSSVWRRRMVLSR